LFNVVKHNTHSNENYKQQAGIYPSWWPRETGEQPNTSQSTRQQAAPQIPQPQKQQASTAKYVHRQRNKETEPTRRKSSLPPTFRTHRAKEGEVSVLSQQRASNDQEPQDSDIVNLVEHFLESPEMKKYTSTRKELLINGKNDQSQAIRGMENNIDDKQADTKLKREVGVNVSIDTEELNASMVALSGKIMEI
jgi:hypothetical protein